MNIATLADLQAPDDQVGRFTPPGLSMAGMLTVDAAAEYQQRAVASADLEEMVPEGTRATFERLRTLHSYGFLYYETFTPVCDLAPLVADLTLRERFLAFHASVVPVVASDGSERELSVDSVGQRVERLKEDKLRLQDWPKEERFADGFGQLLRWARGSFLLSGQRARYAEKQLARWRNLLAHLEPVMADPGPKRCEVRRAEPGRNRSTAGDARLPRRADSRETKTVLGEGAEQGTDPQWEHRSTRGAL